MQNLISQSDVPVVKGWKVGNLNGGETRYDLSKQWISRPHDQRFLSLNDLKAHVASRAERASEATFATHKMELIAPDATDVESLQQLYIASPDGKERAMSHLAFGQLAVLGGAPAAYLRKLPSPIVADALTYGLRYNRGRDEVKSYATDEEALCVTGPDYGRIFDHEVVEAVQMFAGNGKGREARTAWDFAQGITAVARNVPNNDDRVEMEREARKILDKVA